MSIHIIKSKLFVFIFLQTYFIIWAKCILKKANIPLLYIEFLKIIPAKGKRLNFLLARVDFGGREYLNQVIIDDLYFDLISLKLSFPIISACSYYIPKSFKTVFGFIDKELLIQIQFYKMTFLNIICFNCNGSIVRWPFITVTAM